MILICLWCFDSRFAQILDFRQFSDDMLVWVKCCLICFEFETNDMISMVEVRCHSASFWWQFGSGKNCLTKNQNTMTAQYQCNNSFFNSKFVINQMPSPRLIKTNMFYMIALFILGIYRKRDLMAHLLWHDAKMRWRV